MGISLSDMTVMTVVMQSQGVWLFYVAFRHESEEQSYKFGTAQPQKQQWAK